MRCRWPFKRCFDSARACLIWEQHQPVTVSYLCCCCSPMLFSASGSTIKACWRKKLFCQTLRLGETECRNSGGVNLSLTTCFGPGEFTLWKEKEWIFTPFRIKVGEFSFFLFVKESVDICEFLCWFNKEMCATVLQLKHIFMLLFLHILSA